MTSIAYEALSAKRKQEQSEGVLPQWMETAGYDLFNKSYLWESNNWNEQIKRIAKNLARHAPTNMPLNKYGATWEDTFFNLVNQNIVVLATPTLANNGTDRGLSVSCSGQYIGDSINSFYSNLHESAVLSKLGFGTSGYFGDVRPRGSSMSAGGQASGVYPVVEDFWTMASKVSQGSARRGSFAGYIPIDHKDYEEIIHKVKVNPDGKHLGVTISRDIARAIANKTSPSMVSRFQKLMELRMMGRGYIHFSDNVDDQQPDMYKKNGLKNHSSGLCVIGSTEILTDKGYVPIKSVSDSWVNVWTGESFRPAKVAQTGVDQEVITIGISGDRDITCTPYHKFFRANFDNNYKYQGFDTVTASELKVGDKLLKNEFPIIEGTKTLDKAYTNGFFTGDGCSYNGASIIYLYADKEQLRNKIEHEGKWGTITPNDHGTSGIRANNVVGLQDKFFVPDSTYTIQDRLTWLSGYLDADGCALKTANGTSLQFASTEYYFLQNVRRMLNTLGVTATLSEASDEGLRTLPKNDGTGSYADYMCKKAWRLTIPASHVDALIDLGLACNRLVLTKGKHVKKRAEYPVVTSITNAGNADTYCFHEPVTHRGVFNGVLTSNCNEITLHQDEEHTYSCILASMNASTYNTWKDTNAVFLAQVLLDCMVSDFIEEATGINGMEKIIRTTIKGRAVGLGITGLHTYMQANELVFGSFESMMFNNEIYGGLRAESDKASQWLAKELGEPLWCTGSGYRNTHRIAQMPNKSSSLIFGQVSEGTNPIVGNVFNQRISTGEVFRINPNFIRLLKSKNKFNDEVLASVSAYHGSVQHLDFLTNGEKELYRTAFEIPQMDVLSMAEQRQKYVDQGQSLNLFLPKNVNAKFVAELHVRALNSDILKGLYYVNTANAEYQVIQTCSACES